MASRKNSTSGNDTPNTPGVNESEIARMKVAALRQQLKDRGVKGTAELKKPDLVKKMVKQLTSDTKASSGTRTSSAGGTSAKKSSTGAAAGKRKATSGNDTPNTPRVNESEIAGMKVAALRRQLKDRGVKGTAELKKPDLVKKLIKELTSNTKSSSKKSTRSATTIA